MFKSSIVSTFQTGMSPLAPAGSISKESVKVYEERKPGEYFYRYCCLPYYAIMPNLYVASVFLNPLPPL